MSAFFKKVRWYFFWVFVACLLGCGGGNAPQNSSVALAVSNSAPLSACKDGGITISSGIDVNGDQVLNPTEITGVQFICNGISPAKAINGVDGAAGNNGIDGRAGDLGQTGATGSTGSIGVAGVNGTNGNTGASGQTGVAGTQGVTGLTTLVKVTVEGGGANCVYGGSKIVSGIDLNANSVLDANEVQTTAYACNGTPAMATAAYAYVFNTGEQIVEIDRSVAFDSDGLIFGVTHRRSDEIVIQSGGIYSIAFSIAASEPSQLGLFVNHRAVEGSVYGSGAVAQQNNGQILLELKVDDVLTLVNNRSETALSLTGKIGGSNINVNASLTIIKVADIR